jgi:oligopeptide/dipeptide ABC transporter ATP-binding protein
MIAAEAPLLAVRDLRTHFFTSAGVVKSVDGVSFELRRGETLALVGESGSGKSVTSLSILQLLPAAGRIVSGEIVFTSREGRTVNLAAASEAEMRQIRGNQIAMVFQEPMSSLNPVYTIGDQIAEAVVLHRRMGKREALDIAAAMLDRVGITSARRRLRDYPHHMSGGMRQRVMIAMALCCNPMLLIADEPTTALDVTVQAQILELLRTLQEELHMGILFITHNLAVVAEIADRVVVMYGGRVVEDGTTEAVFRAPRHPYTRALFDSLPKIGSRAARLRAIPGEPPNPMRTPPGCAFAPRCEFAIEECSAGVPELACRAEKHWVRCIREGRI